MGTVAAEVVDVGLGEPAQHQSLVSRKMSLAQSSRVQRVSTHLSLPRSIVVLRASAGAAAARRTDRDAFSRAPRFVLLL